MINVEIVKDETKILSKGWPYIKHFELNDINEEWIRTRLLKKEQ